MVGSAKGRSMMELTSALPRKSSRTSTQAMARPATEFTTATAKDIHSVSSSAATASGWVMAAQKPDHPLLNALDTERREREQDEERQVGDGERGAPDPEPPSGRRRPAQGSGAAAGSPPAGCRPARAP